jgi:hypothetical protein
MAPGFTITPEAEKKQRDTMAAAAAEVAANAARETALDNQVSELMREKKWAEAEGPAREHLARLQRRLGPERREVRLPQFRLAMILLQLRKLDEAEPLARTALQLAERFYGPASRQTRGLLGQVWFAQRRFAEAEPHLIAFFDFLKSRPPQSIGPAGETAQSIARQTAESLAELYAATNQPAKTAEWKKTAADLAVTTTPPPPPARKQPAKK